MIAFLLAVTPSIVTARETVGTANEPRRGSLRMFYAPDVTGGAADAVRMVTRWWDGHQWRPLPLPRNRPWER